tara:strand:+ start:3827 stop:5869 length:2043 start_codon:yes stop_codon:yes gene_type:complete
MASKKEIKEKHVSLKNEINHHNFLYHNKDQPEITDNEYDQLFQELLKLENDYVFLDKSDSPTSRVGDTPQSDLKEFFHEAPMLSLDNAFEPEDLYDFEKRTFNKIKKQTLFYSCEPKIDGVAVSLIYEKGKFIKAGTRGDGEQGEDITHNVKTIKQIPLMLNGKNHPDKIEIRGEIYCEKTAFDNFNKEYAKSGQKTFANPRNFVAGSIRQLNPEIAAARPLKIQLHSLGYVDQKNFFKSHQEMLNTFLSWNLPINPDIELVNSIEEVISYCDRLTNKREALNYEIDGVVIKIDDVFLQQELGFSSRSPKWSIAKKFKAEEGTTEVLSVNFQMGRTGALTPVANLKPVKLGGVTISNATLHNMDEVERLDIRIGDFVKVKRAGDVIPKVIKVEKNKRNNKTQKIKQPTHCSSCSRPIAFFEGLTPNLDLARLKNEDQSCYGYSQFKETLKHFVSRQAMDIEGLGSKTIDQMVDKGIIKSIKDLYLLRKESFRDLDGFAEKSINNLLSSINKSKNIKLSNFIYALGIKEIGLETSKNLSKRFLTIENIYSATVDDFISVDDIGEVASSNLHAFFSDKSNIKFLKEIINLGFKLEAEKVLSRNSKIEDKKIAITGKLSSISRDELKSKLEDLGVKVVNSISKNTDYIIVGSDAGSKLAKAKALNIEIISDEDLDSFLTQNEN